jgi:hypothetical protein
MHKMKQQQQPQQQNTNGKQQWPPADPSVTTISDLMLFSPAPFQLSNPRENKTTLFYWLIN